MRYWVKKRRRNSANTQMVYRLQGHSGRILTVKSTQCRQQRKHMGKAQNVSEIV